MFVITENSPEAFEEFLTYNSIDRYRARQILHWIYQKSVFEFSGFKNIPKPVIDFLKSKCIVLSGQLIRQVVSEKDKTTKFLIRLPDGHLIESALLYSGESAECSGGARDSSARRRSTQKIDNIRPRLTACLSVQVGCPVRCVFCASARSGFRRNLSISEIISQYLLMNKVSFDKNKCISNIVFMGIGEPFLNYNNLIGAIDILTHSAAANIASRHITISTAGVIPSIKRLAGYKKQIKLSISLHSAIDKKRSVLVPLNKKYNINSLIEAAKYYIGKTGKLITFEYVLIKGINDTQEDIKRLAGVLKGVACKVNVIPYNKIEGLEFEATPHKDVKYFINTLLKNDIKVTGRLRKGHDINSGCGQLKALFCLGV